MKSPRVFFLVVTSCLFFAASATGLCTLSDPRDCAYITSLTGQQVLAVDRTATGAVPFVVRTLNNGELAEEATVGPDNRVYVALPTNNRIIRMDLNGANRETVYDKASFPSGPSGPYGVKFNAQLDLFLSSKGPSATGIWRIAGAAKVGTGGAFNSPVNVFSSAVSAGGMALTPTGDLLVTLPSSAKIIRLAAPTYSSASDVVTTGLVSPVSIATDSAGKMFVAQQGGVGTVVRCKADGSCDSSPYVTFDAPDIPYDIEVTLDKTIFVTTGDPSENGKLWRITGQNTKFLVTTLPKRNGKFPPAVGLAVPGSSRTIVAGISTGLHKQKFNWDSFQLEVTNAALGGSCTLNVTAEQKRPQLLKDILEASPATAGKNMRSIQFDGQYGWAITFGITPAPSCLVTDPSDVFMSGLFTPPTGTVFNPRGAKMPDGCSSLSPTCTQAILLDVSGYYATSPTELFPTDPGVGNITPPGYSEFFLVDLPVPGNTLAEFCGFLPPLNPDGSSSFKSGQNVSFKFQVADDCDSADPTFMMDAVAVLSVARINTLPNLQGNAVFDRKLVDDSGSSVPVAPTFRIQQDQYVFTANSSGWEVGTYEAGVVNNNRFVPQKIRFNIVK